MCIEGSGSRFGYKYRAIAPFRDFHLIEQLHFAGMTHLDGLFCLDVLWQRFDDPCIDGRIAYDNPVRIFDDRDKLQESDHLILIEQGVIKYSDIVIFAHMLAEVVCPCLDTADLMLS